jgi:hypothetical protein
MNTIQKGAVRCIIFKDTEAWYGVALEFNLVVEGDTPEIVAYELNQAIVGYVESAKISNVRTEHILNQSSVSEYEELWNALANKKPIPSPYLVHSFGTQLTY